LPDTLAFALADQLTSLAQAVRLQETIATAVIEGNPDGLVAINQYGTIVMVNASLERMTGYSRKDLLGKPVEILVPEGSREKHVMHRLSYLIEPSARQMKGAFTMQAADGSAIPVLVALYPAGSNGDHWVVATVRGRTG
jgi:PAS domain S-box-containing protein